MEKQKLVLSQSLALELFFLDSQDRLRLKNQDIQADIIGKNFMRSIANLMIGVSSLIVTRRFQQVGNNSSLFSSIVFGSLYYTYHASLYFGISLTVFTRKYLDVAEENQDEILKHAKIIEKEKIAEIQMKIKELEAESKTGTSESSLDNQDSESRYSLMAKTGNESVKGFGVGLNEQYEDKTNENLN